MKREDLPKIHNANNLVIKSAGRRKICLPANEHAPSTTFLCRSHISQCFMSFVHKTFILKSNLGDPSTNS